MKRLLVFAVIMAAALLFPGVASAQSGHFNANTVDCMDIGTQVSCDGKVAGLGGTTFTITVQAAGTATVTCTNPGGQVVEAQGVALDVQGASGPFATPRNGQANFQVTSNAPVAPAGTCPNPGWTAAVTDVEFGDATLTLLEDGTVSDTITVPVA
jgi:hypothetical protein